MVDGADENKLNTAIISVKNYFIITGIREIQQRFNISVIVIR
jgi:hypothetical protein